jgi:signal transduction histidine kinase
MGDGSPTPDGKGIQHPEGMRAVRDLAAGVVHEINNILGVVIGNAHLVRKNASSPVAVEKYAGEIKAAADEGKELMRQLAALASNDSLAGRPLSLNDLAANAMSGLDAAIEFDLSAQDAMVSLDLWLAQESLSALARFMAQTTSVSSIRVVTRVIGSAVALTFEDDGGSLTAKELRSFFAPFVKAERRPKPGTGLARLADLASRFDGHVAASNCEPHGLRVVLTLPVVA